MLPALNDRYLITIFSYSKNESRMVRDVLDELGVPFAITENRRGF